MLQVLKKAAIDKKIWFRLKFIVAPVFIVSTVLFVLELANKRYLSGLCFLAALSVALV